MICWTLHVKEMVSLNMASLIVRNNICACIRNGFIEYGLVNSVEQSLRWQIEYKIFLYYLLCMICVTLHVKEMVSLNMSLFLVRNDISVGKLSIRSFFIIYYV